MTPPLIRWTLLLGLVLGAAPLRAQGTETPAPEPADTSSSKTKPRLFGGLRYGAPLGGSIYGAVMLARPNALGYTGPTLAAEVGRDGMRASLGVGAVWFGSQRAQVSVIRTWDPHGDVRADQTYIGPEVAVGMILGVTIGHYWRVGDGEGPARCSRSAHTSGSEPTSHDARSPAGPEGPAGLRSFRTAGTVRGSEGREEQQVGRAAAGRRHLADGGVAFDRRFHGRR